MTDDDLRAKLMQKSAESAAKADALLADELATLSKATKTDLEALRPKVTDQDTYNKLIAVVDEATQKNMDIASLQKRIKQLGTNGVQLAKEVAGLLTIVP